MPRLAALLLLVLFSFSLISPAFAPGPAASLPACCRKAGAHKCGMDSQRQHSAGPSLRSLKIACPQFPAAHTTPAAGKIAPVCAAQSYFAGLLSHPAVQTQTHALLRLSRWRSSQKRGPPTLFS